MDGVKLESNPYSDLIAISDDVLEAVASKESIDSVNEFLSAVAETAHQFEWGNLQDAASLYAALVQLLTCSRDDVVLSSEESDEISTAILNGVSEMRLAMSYGPDADADMKRTADLAKERWGAYIELLDDPRATCVLEPAVVDTQNGTSGEVVPSEDDVSRILSAVSDIEQPPQDDGETTEKRADPQAGPADASAVTPMLIDNAELAEAFLDDAGKCVAAMEDAVLEFEQDLTNHEPLRQICRELHTLKGASGSVGLAELADYLHHVEDGIQSCCDGNGSSPDVDAILQCVDTVRQQM
ncbi:MAG: Hpt domain-containing protein, partial [Planctomycetes bacterium]|nr:Hpt domain-containing protein [Planctomycetota bacterium]